jgi:hypothetical protein
MREQLKYGVVEQLAEHAHQRRIGRRRIGLRFASAAGCYMSLPRGIPWLSEELKLVRMKNRAAARERPGKRR